MKDMFFRCKKLIYRFLISMAILIWAIVDSQSIDRILSQPCSISVLWLLWVVFIVEIVLRIVPSKDIGVSKMYARHFAPVEEHTEALHTLTAKASKGRIAMAILYLMVLCTIGVLYAVNILSRVAILLVVLAFWVCSEVCVQIFCPFSYLMLGKVCCNKCTIYNWDYLMICAPLVYICTIDTMLIVLLSIVLVIVWEIQYYRYSYRYYDATNSQLKCKNCTNKNCLYKANITNIVDKILHKHIDS